MSTGILTVDETTHIRAKGENPAWHRYDREAKVADLIGLPWKEFGTGKIIRCKSAYQRVNAKTGKETMVFTPEKDAIIRINRNYPKGILMQYANEGYQFFQDSLLREMVWNAFDSAGVHPRLVYDGTLGGGKVSFMRFRIDSEADSMVEGRKFQSQFTVVDPKDSASYNGGSICFFDHHTDTVCFNTIAIAVGQSRNFKASFKHTRNASIKLDAVMQELEAIYETREAFFNRLRHMAEVPVTPQQAERILAYFEGKDRKDKDLSVQSANKVVAQRRLFKSGTGNKGETLLDLYNGVTEFYSKGPGSGKTTGPGQKWGSSEFGSAMSKKQEFLSILTDKDGDILTDEDLDMLADMGETILAKTEEDVHNKTSLLYTA